MAALRRRKAMACTVAFVFSLIVDLTRSLPEVIKVGGLFEAGDDVLELTFRYAVDRVNSDGEMLPKSLVSAQVERLEQHDSFQAARKVCDLLEQGLAAVFGPQSVEASSAVQSTCDVLQVPHIETRWDYRTRHDNHSLNLYPHPGALGKAYLDFVKSKNWNYFAILYEDNDALIRMQELLKDPFVRDRRVVVRQFPPNQEYRKLLKELGRGGVKNIVLDVATSNIHTVLKHAQQVDMMSEYYNYFITSLDLHTVDLEDFQYGGTNITGFRLVHQESPDFADVLKDWKNSPLRYHKTLSIEDDFLKTEVALMYDAVKLLSKALHDLDRSQKIHIRSISCDNEDPWPHGNSLVKYMRMIQFQGLTGNIKFDHRGFRTDFTLKVIELTHEGLKQAGHWNSSGLFASSNYTRAIEEIIQSLKNKTLIVTSIINHPYTIRKVGGANEKLEGNDRYEGYCVDLIDAISKNLGFDYVFKEVDDGRYGSRNEHGEWNGMIRELIDGKADLAIGDLTITYVREQAVDFTMPFMNLGISILFRKPNRKIPNLFSFLSPLSVEVWLYMVTAFLGVTLFLFIVARFSPYEWTNPHPCNQEPEELENQFTILNTLWFTIGCLMQQGCELTPRAVSTRVVAGMWWFFTLIMVSSYTANLAAFLTVERMVSPIEGAEDLAKQTSIHYGCVGSGSTKVFFKESKIPTYKRMWAFMESARPSVFTDSNMKGVERVRKGNYAFLMESTTIEYIVERNCDLTQVGGMLDSKGYGIATPSGSPYRTPLSSAILQLQESGTLHLLKERWWKQKNPGRVCKSEETSRSSGSASELGLANVGGVFVVLLAGLALACIAAVVEFIWKARKEAEEEREPLCVELCRELKFAVICGGSTKPIRKKSDGGGGGTVMGSVMNAHIHGQPENGLPFMPLTGFNTSSTKETFS